MIFPPPLIYMAGLAAGMLLEMFFSIEFPSLNHRIWAIGVVIFVVGAIPGLWALVSMYRAKTSPEPWHPTRVIVSDGPYRFTRNPMYLTFSLAMLGLGLMFANVWILLWLPIVMLVIHHGVILREERYLERKFGEEYTRYKARVRRWI